MQIFNVHIKLANQFVKKNDVMIILCTLCSCMVVFTVITYWLHLLLVLHAIHRIFCEKLFYHDHNITLYRYITHAPLVGVIRVRIIM